MTAMPDFAIRATFGEVLPEDVDERLLDLVPGTVITHPLEGGEAVAVPVTHEDFRAAAQDLSWWAERIRHVTGVDPVSLSLDPLED
jgi:hypothetical protein